MIPGPAKRQSPLGERRTVYRSNRCPYSKERSRGTQAPTPHRAANVCCSRSVSSGEDGGLARPAADEVFALFALEG